MRQSGRAYTNNETTQVGTAFSFELAGYAPNGKPQYFLRYRCVWFNEIDYTVRIVAMATFAIHPGGEIEIEEISGPISAKAVRAIALKKAGQPNKREKADIISLDQFDALIPDEAAAIAFMEERRWGIGSYYCPRCGENNCYRVKSGKPQPFRCRDCRKYFSVKVRTPMENSNLGVRTWLKAIHLVHTFRKGVAALTMHNLLNVDYRTAWFLDHRIREGMRNKNSLMAGIVQVDESYIGGKLGNMHKANKPDNYMDNKAMVFGLRDASGRVIIFPIPDKTTATLEMAILDHVAPGSIIYTDEYVGYRDLSDFGYIHQWISHGAGQYVDGMVTTNGIESFWSLLKRGYIGVFHYMSLKHLHRYCNEFSYRQNAGKGNGLDTIGALVKNMEGHRLSYEMLTGHKIGEKKVQQEQEE